MNHTETLPVYTDCDDDVFQVCLYGNPTAYPAPAQDGRYSLLQWWDNPTPVCMETDGEWRIDPPEIGLFLWPELDVQDGYAARGGRWIHEIQMATFTGPKANSEISNAHAASQFVNTLEAVASHAGPDYLVVLDCGWVTVNSTWLQWVKPNVQANWPDLASRLEFRNLAVPLEEM